ncbi:amino acid permease [Candidatus Babeliales bacterium]|nr:amino acid permease [Candidatus Babeliales bacterium]
MKSKISLFLAILININIVIGGGFFLSTKVLSQKSGIFSALAWLMVGIILLPLVLVLAKLSKAHPVSGGLYVYSHKALGPFWGFLSGWGYYVGTAAGNAVILHAFRKLAEEMGLIQPILSLFKISGFGSDIFFIALFATLNLFNIELLGKIEVLFTILKTIPFALVIISSFFLFTTSNITPSHSFGISGMLNSIPIVLFAYVGIEACCAIAHIIKDGKKNTSKAILIAMGIIVSLYTVIQFLIVGIHGPAIIDPFVGIIPKLTNNPILIKWGTHIVGIAILSSFLGGFYSMFYTNNWNLFAMAEENKIPLSKQLLKLNTYKSPWLCIFAQAILIIIFLMITKNIENLMTMSDFGVVIAYLLSTIAFIAMYKSKKSQLIVSGLSLLSCSYLLYACFNNLAKSGILFLLPYLGLLGIGLVGYKVKSRS